MSNEVLYVVNDPDNFLLHRRSVADALGKDGWTVEVAGPAGDGVQRVIEAGYQYHPIDLSRKSTNPMREGRSLRDISRLYRRLSPTLVHQFTVKPVVYGGIAGRRTGVPALVSTITGLGFVFSSSTIKARVLRPVVRTAYKRALNHPNHVLVFQNADDQVFLKRMGLSNGGHNSVIPGSGIDTSKYPLFPTGQNDVPVVALAARMLWDKGIAEFVQASKILHAQGISVRFVLIGDSDSGNPAAIPRRKLTRLEQQGLIELWGWRDNIIDLLAEIDIACLPSHREGFPRYLLEAATRGRPIVATDVPGCRAIVRHQENGLLVPPRDPVALAKAIRTLVNDPDLRKRMGMAGRRRLEEEFDTKHIVAATIKVYEEALARSPAT